MSEPSCSVAQQPVCDVRAVPGEGGKDVDILENTSTSWKPALENQCDPNETITVETDSSSYCVTWTVYIALAVPPEEGIYKPRCTTMLKNSNDSSGRLAKSLQAQSRYHIEYKLFPGNTETTKMDVVVYGPVAKLCQENDYKILKTWQEGDQLWLGWAHIYTIPVDRDLLIELVSHRIELQIWNSKDKLLRQTRSKAHKTFSLKEDCLEDARNVNGCVKTMVNQIRALIEKKSKAPLKVILFQSKSELGSETVKNTVFQDSGHQKLELDILDIEDIKTPGTASVEINPIPLLAGDAVNEHFPVRSAGVTDVLCNISLDKPLISDQLKAELNPLVITILSATSLPSSPIPFHILQEECLPVYCQYKFHNLKPHRTNSHKQSSDIYFRDINVILTGLMSSAEVREFLSGPPLEIEVHDRDMKLDKKPEIPTTIENTNTHGVAHLSLSELLRGKKSLKLSLAIKCCRSADRRESAERRKTDVAGRRGPLPRGHYYENNSQLKVQVDIARPIDLKTTSSSEEPCSGPFGRVIYLFGCDNSSMVMKLRSEILQINAAAFRLDCYSLEHMETALSNHVMNFKHDGSKDVDFVSGFHVQDVKMHIFVIEGLKDKAVKRLWKTCPMTLSENEEEQVIVHYNSGLGFFNRLYDSLDLCLSSIQLHESLASIVRKPRMFIRGAVPQACYQALTRLDQLCEIRLLSEAVQHNLFPSPDMILSVNKEFGTCAQQSAPADIAGNTLGNTARNMTGERPVQPVRVKRVHLLNTEYIRRRHNSQQKQQLKNFIQENIKNVQEQNERLPKKDAGFFFQVSVPADQPVHMYSIQTFNLHVRAKELLQKEMAKMPGRRFTYCQQYHSATVEPGPAVSETRASFALTATPWRSGVDRSAAHPLRPHDARVEELREPWRENMLHANVLKPTLPRGAWTWDRRSEDFQSCCKAPSYFGSPPPFCRAAAASSRVRKNKNDLKRQQLN